MNKVAMFVIGIAAVSLTNAWAGKTAESGWISVNRQFHGKGRNSKVINPRADSLFQPTRAGIAALDPTAPGKPGYPPNRNVRTFRSTVSGEWVNRGTKPMRIRVTGHEHVYQGLRGIYSSIVWDSSHCSRPLKKPGVLTLAPGAKFARSYLIASTTTINPARLAGRTVLRAFITEVNGKIMRVALPALRLVLS